LPAKVQASSDQAKKFYEHRMPANYSTISAELDDLAQQTHVRKAGVAYTPVPVFEDLEQVGLDVRLAGEYEPLMRYINALERDKLFFIINGLTFTGQQGGLVGVRLRLTTYIHAADVNQMVAPADSIPRPSNDTATGEGSPSAAMSAPGGLIPASSIAGGQ
jgi:hypothetical protein